MSVTVYEPIIVLVGQPGLPGPAGPAGPGGDGGATAATGAVPPSPGVDGQLWRDPASGRLMIYYNGAWRDQVLDGQNF
ncbi:hypothetical protein [Methylomonas sp. HYX-M1]|uniref:hypothetical protein n=1 Tax=Methylomonas sp. HYX-M1 TaxID=3139307 RepID=UPI00345B7079